MIRSQLTAQLVTLTVVLTLGSLHTTYVAQPINGLAQEKERTIKRTKFFNEPIKILEIKVAGKSVRDEGTVNHRGKIANVSDIKFTAENDWLKGMQFVVQNVSAKPIIAVKIDSLVKHSALDVPVNVLAIKGFRESPLRPGATAILTVDAQIYDLTLGKMKAKDISAVIDSVQMYVGRVQFDDDTAWSQGLIFSRDSKDPDRWIPNTASARNNFKKASYTVPVKGARNTQSTCVESWYQYSRKPNVRLFF